MKGRPSKADRPRPFVCYHEAGHALMRWYFGHQTDKAIVRTLAEMQADRQDGVRGCVEGYGITPTLRKPRQLFGISEEEKVEILTKWQALAEQDLVVLQAGVFAEAKYNKTAASDCVLSGGASDIWKVQFILDNWFDPHDRKSASHLSEARAKAVLRSDQGWQAVQGIAAVLLDKCQADGDEIDLICTKAFDREQATVDSWLDHWPPTLDQLRSGWLPLGTIQAAA